MRPNEKMKIRRKRDHKIRCLKCDLMFLSTDLKSNRICDKCKEKEFWKNPKHFEPD